MTHPIIAITTRERSENRLFSLRMEYVDAVRRAGGIPALVPSDEPSIDRLLSRVDGLLLTGGGDIDPAVYGGASHERTYGIDHARDRSELALVRAARDIGMPILGICRGAQVINVAFGGTLVEHIAEGREVLHRTSDAQPTPHAVRVEPGSMLASILGETDVVPISSHHQAVRSPAEGFRIVARAPDGVIEGLELPGYPFLLAVQWHPEMSAEEDPMQQRIFDDFVRAAARYAAQDRPATQVGVESRPVAPIEAKAAEA